MIFYINLFAFSLGCCLDDDDDHHQTQKHRIFLTPFLTLTPVTFLGSLKHFS